MSAPGLLAAVAGMWTVAAVTPGPNFLMIARLSASRSRRQGLAAVAGVGAGTALWGLAGFFGVQAMFALAPWLYAALALAGAAWLGLTGLRIIAASFGPPPAARADAAGPALRLGLMTSVSNPKSALLVGSLFAALMPLGAPLPLGLAAVAEMVAISVAWYAAVACLLTTRPMASAYARAARWVDRVAGVVFVGFGARILLERA